MLQGSMVAIVTPMSTNGDVDEKSLCKLLDHHLEQGTDGIVVVGTTGESVTLSVEEQRQVIACTMNHVAGQVPVIAGTGSNSTAKSITATQVAKQIGVDACLLVTPYYNKPTQEGLYQHFSAIADAVDIPQLLYNVPGRTACDMLPATVARLAKHDNIVGIKEATGDIKRGQEIKEFCNNTFNLYSGDDPTALELMLNGAKGVISVTANVAPKAMHEMCMAALANDAGTARNIDAKLAKLHQHLFLEANPIPVKWALHLMGFIETGIRLPLTPLAESHRATLEQTLRACELL